MAHDHCDETERFVTEYSPTDLAAQLKNGLLSFPATHFTNQLEFAEDGYRKHLAWLAEYPVAGLFAAGGTGEGFSLTYEETDRVVGAAVREVAGTIPVLAPATGGTLHAVAQAKAAAAAGSRVAVSTPQKGNHAVPDQAGLVLKGKHTLNNGEPHAIQQTQKMHTQVTLRPSVGSARGRRRDGHRCDDVERRERIVRRVCPSRTIERRISAAFLHNRRLPASAGGWQR